LTPASHHAHHLRGIICIMIAVSFFALLDATAKYLAKFYPVAGIVWARYFFQALAMLVVLGPRLGLGLVRTKRPGLQIARGTVLVGASLTFFTALALMPLAEGSAISFTAPLLLMAMSVPLLRERVDGPAWIAVWLGFSGVLLIIRPGTGVFTWVALLPLVTAFCNAFYQILTRKLSGTDNTLTTLFYGGLVGAVIMSTLLPFYWTTPQSLFHAFLYVMLGVLAGIGHYLLIKAFEYAPASTLAPFIYVQVVAVLVLGYLVFDSFPDGWSLAGMAIIVASGAFVATRQARRMLSARADAQAERS
jgi:drug/metabolite transporter (DMT)-like permease